MIVYQAFTGPAAVNTRAKAFFASKGVAVNDTGTIAANAPSVAALNALRSYFGAVYEGVPLVPADAPGKRSRAAYVATLTTDATWRTRIGAAAAFQQAV